MPDEEQESFWRELMEQPSVKDVRAPVQVGPTLYETVRPVVVSEYLRALAGSHESAPGSDMVTLSDIKKVDPETMCAHFNLRLLCE